MSNTNEDLKRQVLSIIKDLENPPELNGDGDAFTAYDYICEALDLEYIVRSDKEYLGSRILVCFGGPNIWINTKLNQVEGYWWDDTCILSYQDNLGVDEAMQEMWECRL